MLNSFNDVNSTEFKMCLKKNFAGKIHAVIARSYRTVEFGPHPQKQLVYTKVDCYDTRRNFCIG